MNTDNELFSGRWAVRGLPWKSGLNDRICVTERGSISMRLLKGDWVIESSEHALGVCHTRGQFKALCIGLGVPFVDCDSIGERASEDRIR